jgi:DNA-directed RNA polymerase specialized sigma24 family protein
MSESERLFPERTAITFIEKLLEQSTAGVRQIGDLVVRDYMRGIHRAFQISKWRDFDEFEALFNEFFLDKVNSKEFYDKWLASGIKLRDWLVNGFMFFIRSECRRRKKDKGNALPDDFPADIPIAERRMAKALAREIAERAFSEAETLLRSKGFETHWKIFVAHILEGMGFRDIGERYGVTERQAHDMARTARLRYRMILQRIFRDHNVPPDQIDREIRDLLDDMGI